MATRRAAAGYTLIEVLIAVAVMMIVSAIAIPVITSAMRRYALNNAAQQIASVVRSARFTAVSKNTVMRVRFDCPENDQYRVVEFTEDSTIDTDTDRCSNAAYPYPDADAANKPDVDGPVLLVPAGTEIGDADDLEINKEGRVTALSGCPTCTAGSGGGTVAIENGFESQTITIGQNGQVAVGTAVPIE